MSLSSEQSADINILSDSTMNFISRDAVVLATNYDNNITIDEDLLTFLKPKFEDFDLKTLLATSPLGKSVLTYYNVYKKLDNTRRNRLCSIIVKHIYNHIVKK